MSRHYAGLLAIGFLVAATQPSLSQSTPPSVDDKVKTITDSLKVLCMATGSESSLNVKGDLDLKAKIKDVLTGNIGAGAKAGTEFTKHEWDGIIGGISKDMTEIQGRQSSEVRQCMKDVGLPLLNEALKQR